MTQLREIAMNNLTFGIPVKSRLPRKAWLLAGVVTLFSLGSSIGHLHSTPHHAIYAETAAQPHAVGERYGVN